MQLYHVNLENRDESPNIYVTYAETETEALEQVLRHIKDTDGWLSAYECRIENGVIEHKFYGHFYPSYDYQKVKVVPSAFDGVLLL